MEAPGIRERVVQGVKGTAQARFRERAVRRERAGKV